MFWTGVTIILAAIGTAAGLALAIVCLVAAGPLGALFIVLAYLLFLKVIMKRTPKKAPEGRTNWEGVYRQTQVGRPNPPEKDSLD